MTFDLKDYFWRIWEDNRQLTLKVAQSFSEDQLLHATPVPNMRPFAKMLLEIASLEKFHMRGLSEGVWIWEPYEESYSEFGSTSDIFNILIEIREYSRRMWPSIPVEKLLTIHEAPPTFGGPSAPPLEWLQYAVENEIHHRAQGYTYLKHLGITPPAFWDRT